MVDLIRNMVVSDHGNPRQFLKGPVPSNIGPGTLDRLRRAGALSEEVAAVVLGAEVPALASPDMIERTPKGKTK